MECFYRTQSLSQFQEFINHVYGLPDDRLYSIFDLLTHQQRFTMRALKGIRKGSPDKIKINLLVAFSWLMAISNRLHIDAEEETWKRFPFCCSYCGETPCICKKEKISKRRKVKEKPTLRPNALASFQEMFGKIYPAKSRTLADAGVHLAEETGEVSEAVHNFLGQHLKKQFEDIKLEIADYTSCIFGVANSAGIDVAKELERMFYKNCHVCHRVPCECRFTTVAQFKT